MKKHLFLASLLLAGSIIASSQQLSNSKWKGVANIPDPYPSQFEFRNDSLFLMAEDMIVEIMSYKLSGDSLTLSKLDGRSPCDVKATGHFKIIWKDGDAFTLESLSDECPERAAAFIGNPWARIKD